VFVFVLCGCCVGVVWVCVRERERGVYAFVCMHLCESLSEREEGVCVCFCVV